ncbi:MAG: hypothetical protein HY457_00080 [Parcubacteria group bacterium]|nr:hypothetical protein [Parcubacteria group bacterium]
MIEILPVVKVMVPGAVAFFIGIAATPFLTHYLYKYKLWRKDQKTKTISGEDARIVPTLASQQQETKVPRMGGIVIWASVAITVFLFWSLKEVFPSEAAEKLNFLSRNQTWLPFFTLIAASLVGLVDDVLVVTGKGRHVGGGLPLRMRIMIVLLIGAIGAWWFFTKLGVSGVMIPFAGEVSLGLLFIPLFMTVMLALFSGSIIDGIDGLAGGVLAIMFAAFAGIAFFQNQIDIAAFSTVVAGGLLAFLWFNIPPARFYMSETGMLGLTTTLTVIAFLTDAVVPLFLIAFPLFAASGSNIIQLISKKYFGRKLLRAAPIHHHFEALGWPPYKIVMRFWVLGAIFALLGMVLALVG